MFVLRRFFKEVFIPRIVNAEVHRLVVVDANTRVVGVLSLSDILKELVLKPSGENYFCKANFFIFFLPFFYVK